MRIRTYKQVVLVCPDCKTPNDVAWMGIGVTGQMLLRATCSECRKKIDGETDADDLLKKLWEADDTHDEQPATERDTVH